MLLLEHKRIPYRRVDLIPTLHPVMVRLLGFPAEARRTDQLGTGNHWRISIADRLGTVPALRLNGERVQTNRNLSRFLDRVRPDPPLFPADPERRRSVEEAEAWGDEFQMPARRLLVAAALGGTLRNGGDHGRLGFLLYKSPRVRKRMMPVLARSFEVNKSSERELLDELPAMLDRVDEWIAAGVLNGDELNAADYMIVSSLALLTYRTDVEPLVMSRPAGALVDRVLPEPASVGDPARGARDAEASAA
jgi:glutathione S-transferase